MIVSDSDFCGGTFEEFFCNVFSEEIDEVNNFENHNELDELDNLNQLESEVFTNYVVHSKDGIFLGYLTKQRLRWHLKKNRYVSIDYKNKILTIDSLYNDVMLKHENDSKKHYSVKKENICISCGTTSNLSKIRIIPHCITKLFPEEYKTGAENILAICTNCNVEIFKKMEQYKKTMYDNYSINLNEITERNNLLKNYKTAIDYLQDPTNYLTKIKFKSKKSLDDRIKKIYNVNIITNDHISNFIFDTKKIIDQFDLNIDIIDDDCNIVNNILVSKIDDFSKFKKDWVKYFFDNIEVNYISSDVKNYLEKY